MLFLQFSYFIIIIIYKMRIFVALICIIINYRQFNLFIINKIAYKNIVDILTKLLT